MVGGSTEMRRALEADGEKLRQLTGRDHGPWPVSLTASQLAFLAELPPVPRYAVDWPATKLTADEYSALVGGGLVEEVWNWTSSSRPNIGRTPLGSATLAEAL